MINNILVPGETYRSISSSEFKVEKFLGAGGQGEVYVISKDGNSLALKWYLARSATPFQEDILQNLVRRSIPNQKFLWPLEIINVQNVNGFGYTMPILNDKFKSFNLWLNKKIEPTLRLLITTCLELADGFHQLHAMGLCYQDLSLNNIYFDPKIGNILIGDTDNIVINGDNRSNIMGTPKYMAPEIVRGDSKPNTQTDLFSLAVMIFYIMFLSHPLEGKKETEIPIFDFEAMKKIYGTEPKFIFDPNDSSNRPDPVYHPNATAFWEIYPAFLKKIFIKAFTDGLFDPLHGRVIETEWLSVLSKLRDHIYYCRHCRAENFYDPDKKINQVACWRCKRLITMPYWIVINKNTIKNTVMLNNDTKLFLHHIDPSRSYDFSQVVAEVVNHPTDPTIWGLRNLTRDKWTAKTNSGKIVEKEPGKSIVLTEGTIIYFGKANGQIAFFR